MSNKPVEKVKVGRVEGAVWRNEYEGEISVSYSFQVNYYSKKNEEWTTKRFFSPTDLPNLVAVAMKLMIKGLKIKNLNRTKKQPQRQPKQQQNTQQSKQSDNQEEIPF